MSGHVSHLTVVSFGRFTELYSSRSGPSALLASADSVRRLHETTWDLQVLQQNLYILQTARRLLELSSSTAGKDCLAEAHPPWCMVQLAFAYHSRYMHSADAKDIEKQIECREALLAVPKGERHHERATQLLTGALRLRFQRSQNPQDIARSVRLLRRLLDRSSQTSAPLLNLPGSTLSDRF
jgi:hypothetical protein